MSIRAKLLSVLAVLGLSMSLVATGAAQTEVDGKVTLDGGSCAMTLTGGSFEFQDIVWNGTRWVQANQSAASINVNITSGWTPSGQTGKCRVGISTGGFTNGTHTITQSYFQAAATQLPGLFGRQPLPASFNLNASNASFQLYIWEFVPRSFSPGDYEGTVTFTFDDGQ